MNKSLTGDDPPCNQLAQRERASLDSDADEHDPTREKDGLAAAKPVAQNTARQGAQCTTNFIDGDGRAWCRLALVV